MREGSEEADHTDVWRVFWQHSKFKDRGGSVCDVDIRKPEALEQSEGAESKQYEKGQRSNRKTDGTSLAVHYKDFGF